MGNLDTGDQLSALLSELVQLRLQLARIASTLRQELLDEVFGGWHPREFTWLRARPLRPTPIAKPVLRSSTPSVRLQSKGPIFLRGMGRRQRDLGRIR